MEKLNAGKVILTLTPTDLVSVVKQSILDNSGYGLTFDVEYVLTQSPEQLLVLADTGRLSPSAGQSTLKRRQILRPIASGRCPRHNSATVRYACCAGGN